MNRALYEAAIIQRSTLMPRMCGWMEAVVTFDVPLTDGVKNIGNEIIAEYNRLTAEIDAAIQQGVE